MGGGITDIDTVAIQVRYSFSIGGARPVEFTYKFEFVTKNFPNAWISPTFSADIIFHKMSQ